ncbi:hypothetical protein [Desulfococcus multivorans]|uniref:hypothetical protein n=1 Tax=Desulfococcus multivorans TaxID=897 RepID=UPI0012947D8F|nr:hypothetical protein [Desulfococcus multivorans]
MKRSAIAKNAPEDPENRRTADWTIFRETIRRTFHCDKSRRVPHTDLTVAGKVQEVAPHPYRAGQGAFDGKARRRENPELLPHGLPMVHPQASGIGAHGDAHPQVPPEADLCKLMPEVPHGRRRLGASWGSIRA